MSMINTMISRREFLAAAGISAAALRVFGGSTTALAGEERSLEFLVVGDSLIWGQGLEEKDKFYTHTAEWLRKEAFGRSRDVNLKVKAHSGATIKFKPDEAEKYKKAGRDESQTYTGELNVGFPSMWKQVEMAAAEYRAEGNVRGADLIMLSAGITDISVEKVLDPFGDDRELPGIIDKTCRGTVSELLSHAASHNPDAVIAVIGYFPMLSQYSKGSRVLNTWLEILDVPPALKPVANNPLSRSIYFRKLLKKGIRRSKIWIEVSDRSFRTAVDDFNARTIGPKAVFIPSPLKDEHAAETSNTKLFRMGKNGTTEDPLAAHRQAACRRELPELKRSTGIEYSVNRCTLAGVGHPNAAGSLAYAETIKIALRSVLNGR